MCGIVGFIGSQEASPILLDGLERLEYRGYDSSGLVVFDQGVANEKKSIGKIKELRNKIGGELVLGHQGIAHTRWATHGEPTEVNAHPHADCCSNVWLVHNGIIENYQKLKGELIARGHIFKSQTDTEVIAHLLEENYAGDLGEALKIVLPMLRGTYGLVVASVNEPEVLYAAKLGSPLVVGLMNDGNIIASDVSAIIRYTKAVVYLEDGELAQIYKDKINYFSLSGSVINKTSEEILWETEQAERGGFSHFMQKEIFEQPETIINSVRGRFQKNEGKVIFGGFDDLSERLRNINRLLIVGCGTARNAALVGEYMLEEFAGLPTEVDYASEFRYRSPMISANTAVLAVSQSGETADTLAAIREAKEKNALTLGLVNVVGSSIARFTEAGIYNHIGPEIAVASTKAFTSQVVLLGLLTVKLGRQRQMSLAQAQEILQEIEQLPAKIQEILQLDEQIKTIAKKYLRATNFAFLGRKYNYPVAIEGAIKLKEVSYVHAEGFAAGEMKHGPIAMIDKSFPSVFIIPNDSVYEKNLSNLQEIKSRQGPIIAIATTGDEKIQDLADDVIYIPKCLEMLTPILTVIPLQLFAYHFASLRGFDVDKPRNLAKSVTVE